MEGVVKADHTCVIEFANSLYRQNYEQLETILIATRLVAGICCLIVAGVAAADAYPGTPRREYRGRIYYYAPISYYSPVWYEANGIITTRQQAGVPLWPEGQFNKIR